MSGTLQSLLSTHLGFLPQELQVIIVSAAPVVELRGGLPLAHLYGMPAGQALVLSLIGNFLPIIPLLLLFRPISGLLLRFSWYQRLHRHLHSRTIRRSRSVERYGALGLILFTAIPFPTTGAYTACLAASFFDIRFRYALIAISAGVLIAGVAITATLYSLF